MGLGAKNMVGKSVLGKTGRAAVRLRSSPDERGLLRGKGPPWRKNPFSAIHHCAGRDIKDRLLVTELTVMCQGP